jgi:hypothetical protein
MAKLRGMQLGGQDEVGDHTRTAHDVRNKERYGVHRMKSGSTQSFDWRAQWAKYVDARDGRRYHRNLRPRERSDVRKALEGLDHTPTYHVFV